MLGGPPERSGEIFHRPDESLVFTPTLISIVLWPNRCITRKKAESLKRQVTHGGQRAHIVC